MRVLCSLLLLLLVTACPAQAQDGSVQDTSVSTQEESVGSTPEDMFGDDLMPPSSPETDSDAREVMAPSSEPPSASTDSAFLPPGPEGLPVPERVAPAKPKFPPRQDVMTTEDLQRAKPTGDAVETLVGRGTQAGVVDREGNVQRVDPQTLVVPRQRSAIPVIPAAPETESGEEEATGEAEPGEETEEDEEAKPPATKNPAEDEEAIAKAAKEQAEKEAAAAEVRQADIQRIRELQHQGAYFYTTDDKPLTPDDVEKRIEEGDLSGIKTVDIYLEEWTTASPPKDEDAAQ